MERLSRKAEVAITCPCGFIIIGKGRGRQAEDRAWKNALERYFDHEARQGGPVIDLNNPAARREVVRKVINIIGNDRRF